MLIQINTSYGIRFDSLSEFLFSDGRMGRNGITFGAYMSYNISHKLLRSTQFLETFLEILELSTFQKQIKPLPPINVAVYWQSGNTEACARKLSQILANNIGNGEEELVSEFMSGIVVCAC